MVGKRPKRQQINMRIDVDALSRIEELVEKKEFDSVSSFMRLAANKLLEKYTEVILS